ncbi:ATP-binding protein [Pseudenhygromyxa sp. WMMC2535]|uniref:AAA family ATPase n=1 Tax=Pseudenhygromyxa sp. WMMC2535 TaxID=2712867 RepID=UPI001C3C5637|nr:ATP-binding protein [Pseudenhygromyxa sp. WMMC2535]
MTTDDQERRLEDLDFAEVAAEIDASVAEEQRMASVRWRAVELARELAMLGARSLLESDPDALIDPHLGFEVHVEAWLRLGDRMRDYLELESRWLDEDDLSLRGRLLDDLGLDEAEFWLTMLAAAAELHPEVAAALSILAEDERVALPTPSSAARLLAAALERPYVELLAAGLSGRCAPLRLGLLEVVEVVSGRPRVDQGLRLAPGELAGLLEARGELGRGEAGELDVERHACAEAPIHDQRLVAGAARLLDVRGLLCVRADSARAARQLALDLACVEERELGVVSAGAGELPGAAGLERLAAEALPVLDLRAWPDNRALPISSLERLADRLGDPGLIVLVGPRAECGRLASVDVPALGVKESQRIWAQVCADELAAAGLARRFRVGLDEARGADAEARDRLVLSGEAREPKLEELAAALRARGARRMGRMVGSLPTDTSIERLVVPPGIRRQLDDIVGWRRASVDVEREYFPGREGLGRGLSCLFSGLPGTGKTFAAQCLANALGLNLYRIDLSQVVSKWLGETEKALAQVFDEAEAGHGLLLFDEADALFGKRTEVKDAHDRYANVEVGYLLQRMESFTGVAILTTNLRSNIDAAFIRRLRFVIEFPMPDVARREQLWAQALPTADKRAADLGPTLAALVERFRLSGGHIHNIGLAAAHLAAAAGRPLDAELLVRATFRELEKAGLARSPADFGPLARWLDEDERGGSRRARGVGS